MSQTTVTTYPNIGSEGRLFAREGAVIETAICDETLGIKPGRLVVLSTTTPSTNGVALPPLAKLPASSGDVTGTGVLGIVLASDHHEMNGGTYPNFTDPTYAKGEAMPILFAGDIWVIAEQAITAARSAAFARFTVNGGATPGELGCFRLDADTAKAVALPGAFFESTALAGGLSVLSFWPRR